MRQPGPLSAKQRTEDFGSEDFLHDHVGNLEWKSFEFVKRPALSALFRTKQWIECFMKFRRAAVLKKKKCNRIFDALTLRRSRSNSSKLSSFLFLLQWCETFLSINRWVLGECLLCKITGCMFYKGSCIGDARWVTVDDVFPSGRSAYGSTGFWVKSGTPFHKGQIALHLL